MSTVYIDCLWIVKDISHSFLLSSTHTQKYPDAYKVNSTYFWIFCWGGRSRSFPNHLKKQIILQVEDAKRFFGFSSRLVYTPLCYFVFTATVRTWFPYRCGNCGLETLEFSAVGRLRRDETSPVCNEAHKMVTITQVSPRWAGGCPSAVPSKHRLHSFRDISELLTAPQNGHKAWVSKERGLGKPFPGSRWWGRWWWWWWWWLTCTNCFLRA